MRFSRLILTCLVALSLTAIPTRRRDAKLQDANSTKAEAACKKKWPGRPKGKDCDEYPFKTTKQGAAYGNGAFSVRYITSGDNQMAGSRLATFYSADRILDDEDFNVTTTA